MRKCILVGMHLKHFVYRSKYSQNYASALFHHFAALLLIFPQTLYFEVSCPPDTLLWSRLSPHKGDNLLQGGSLCFEAKCPGRTVYFEVTCPWGTLHFWRQVTSWHSVIKPNPGSNSNLRLYTSAIYVMHGHTWFGLRHIPPRVIIKLCQREFNRWISLFSINYKISPTTWKILMSDFGLMIEWKSIDKSTTAWYLKVT